MKMCELRTGMVVELKDRSKALVISGRGLNTSLYGEQTVCLLFEGGCSFTSGSHYKDDMTCPDTSLNIQKVFKPTISGFKYIIRAANNENLIWERKEIPEPKFEIGQCVFDKPYDKYVKITDRKYDDSLFVWKYKCKYAPYMGSTFKLETELEMP